MSECFQTSSNAELLAAMLTRKGLRLKLVLVVHFPYVSVFGVYKKYTPMLWSMYGAFFIFKSDLCCILGLYE